MIVLMSNLLNGIKVVSEQDQYLLLAWKEFNKNVFPVYKLKSHPYHGHKIIYLEAIYFLKVCLLPRVGVVYNDK